MKPSHIHRRRRRFALCFALVSLAGLGSVAAPARASTLVRASTGAPTRGNSRAFIRVELPKRTIYVGESVPVTIRAYYEAGTGVTVTGSPKPSDATFTLDLGDAKQGDASLHGEPYLVVSWKGHLSPVKAGRYELSISLPSTLEWQTFAAQPAAPGQQDQGADDDPFGGMLSPFGDSGEQGDPFDWARKEMQRMQRMMNQGMQGFATGTTKRDVVIASPAIPLEVLPLPTAGRPASFTGAVGHFDLWASVDHSDVRAGEPVDLWFTVRGMGNFDRVKLGGVASTDVLETYPPTPKQKDGVKTFEQAVIPRTTGTVRIPQVEFSYFDPEKKAYVTTHSPAIPLNVAPGQALASTSSGHIPESASGPTLAPNDDSMGRTVPSLRPLFLKKGFWLGQLAPLFVFGSAASFIAGRRRLSSNPRRAARRAQARALREHRLEMDRATAAGDAARFFGAARGALQQKLGPRFGIAPGALTLVELERRLEGDELATVRAVFDADSARFGVGAAERDLDKWNRLVQRALATKEDT